ncbi:MAG: hypothetical protein ACFFEV_06790 [Candidatus Thorarchaeota archaeon]
MIEEPKSALEEIASDPNFLMILAGAVMWFVGYYIWVIGPFITSTGFVLVCFYTTLTSLKRPVAQAWPGLLFGGLLQIIGYYLSFIPILGIALVVTGGVMIVYFTIPLALQRGELPVLTRLQKLIESKKKEEKIEDIEAENTVDAEIVEEDNMEDDEL